jgi:hypothetical protein
LNEFFGTHELQGESSQNEEISSRYKDFMAEITPK